MNACFGLVTLSPQCFIMGGMDHIKSCGARVLQNYVTQIFRTVAFPQKENDLDQLHHSDTQRP